MTMYKPGTQLIITDLWAADAAHKLGFEVETYNPHAMNSQFWERGFEVLVEEWYTGKEYTADKWRITVTESGPNAAERFLPQLDDYVELQECQPRIVCANEFKPLSESLIPLSFARMYAYDKGIRIIERDGIPFPQFSEMIAP